MQSLLNVPRREASPLPEFVSLNSLSWPPLGFCVSFSLLWNAGGNNLKDEGLILAHGLKISTWVCCFCCYGSITVEREWESRSARLLATRRQGEWEGGRMTGRGKGERKERDRKGGKGRGGEIRDKTPSSRASKLSVTYLVQLGPNPS